MCLADRTPIDFGIKLLDESALVEFWEYLQGTGMDPTSMVFSVLTKRFLAELMNLWSASQRHFTVWSF